MLIEISDEKIGENGIITIEPNEDLKPEMIKELKNVYVKMQIGEQKFMFDAVVEGGTIKEKNLAEFKGKKFKALIFSTE